MDCDISLVFLLSFTVSAPLRATALSGSAGWVSGGRNIESSVRSAAEVRTLCCDRTFLVAVELGSGGVEDVAGLSMALSCAFSFPFRLALVSTLAMPPVRSV